MTYRPVPKTFSHSEVFFPSPNTYLVEKDASILSLTLQLKINTDRQTQGINVVSLLIDSEVFTVSGCYSMSWLNYLNASVLPLKKNRSREYRICCSCITQNRAQSTICAVMLFYSQLLLINSLSHLSLTHSVFLS